MKTWAKVAVSLGLLALLFILLPWNDVRTAVARVPAAVWAGVLAGFFAGHFTGALKWRMLVRASHAPLTVADAVRCYCAGLFANLCLPSLVGGDVLRAALAGRATGRMEAAFLAGAADRVIDVATLGILIAAGGLFARDALPGSSGEALVVLIVVAAAAIALASPLLLKRPLAKWPRKLRRPVGRGLVALRRLVRNPGNAAAALVLSIAVQSWFVLLNAWIGSAIGITLPLAVWFVAWPLAKAAGLMPISLGGLAVRDATFGALLVPLGVPMAIGVVAHLVWQSVLIVGGLMAGGLWWLMSRGARGGFNPFTALKAAAPRHG